MRERWQWLFGCAIVSLAGVAWLLSQLGAPATLWGGVERIGMMACAITGLAAAIADYPKKWPAAVALLCAVPTAQNILFSFPSTMELMIHLGVSFLLYVAGAVGAVAMSIAILVMHPPAPPSDEVVARARIVR